jgi:hypothetical protein
MNMMPPRGVRRIDRGLIHPNAQTRRSPKSRYEVLYGAGLLDQGSDTSSSPTLLVVGTSGLPLLDGRCQGSKQVKDEG